MAFVINSDFVPLQLATRGDGWHCATFQPASALFSFLAGTDVVAMTVLRHPLFWIVVCIPNLLSAAYFSLVAAPVYESTASLLIYRPNGSAVNVSAMLSGDGGGSPAGAHIVQNYLRSWEEYRRLDQTFDLSKIYAHGDFVSRFGGLATLFQTNDIALWGYYKGRLKAKIPRGSGILDLCVSSYSPAVSTALAQRMVRDATAMLSGISTQQQARYAANAVAQRKEAATRLAQAESALAAYQTETGMHDPDKRYQADLDMLTALKARQTSLTERYGALRHGSPNNPVVGNLRAAMSVVERKIATIERRDRQLSVQAARYSELLTETQADQAALMEIHSALQRSELGAIQNGYHVDVLSAPSSPSAAALPKRLLWIVGILLASLVLWVFVR